MNNIIENNRLIAEFLGYNEEIVNDEVYFTLPDMLESLSDEELHYHSDWNWLMEVVEKIESINFVVNIREGHVSILNNGSKPPFYTKSDFVEESKKEAVYNTCIEFIKWYNKQYK